MNSYGAKQLDDAKRVTMDRMRDRSQSVWQQTSGSECLIKNYDTHKLMTHKKIQKKPRRFTSHEFSNGKPETKTIKNNYGAKQSAKEQPTEDLDNQACRKANSKATATDTKLRAQSLHGVRRPQLRKTIGMQKKITPISSIITSHRFSDHNRETYAETRHYGSKQHINLQQREKKSKQRQCFDNHNCHEANSKSNRQRQKLRN